MLNTRASNYFQTLIRHALYSMTEKLTLKPLVLAWILSTVVFPSHLFSIFKIVFSHFGFDSFLSRDCINDVYIDNLCLDDGAITFRHDCKGVINFTRINNFRKLSTSD